MNSHPRLFCAIDTADLIQAKALCNTLAKVGGVGVKLGLEFFGAHGPQGVKAVIRDLPLFLDLKLHDIPNTVAGAMRAVAGLKPRLMTIHVFGGRGMMRAAVDAAAEAAAAAGLARARILGVTVLTSLDDSDLHELGLGANVIAEADLLARLAREVGLDGLVCSPQELDRLRSRVGPGMLLVTPGIRPAGSATGDQKRVTTPAEAVTHGADILVVGRPITQAPDPAEAARAILAEIAAAQAQLPAGA